MAKLEYLEISDLRGGRNGADPPRSIPDNQVVEAINVDWYDGMIAHRRGGATALTLTSAPFTGILAALWRHLPSADETAAEVWGIDSAFKIGRYTGGAWTTITPTDAVSATAHETSFTSLNQKLFVGHKSAQDRLHVWDGTTLRRVGFATPAAATVADTGGGAYAATIRYYKVLWEEVSGADTRRRSELSAAVTFTPSGAGASARITRPALASEGETHWVIYASADNSTFYRLTSVVSGTTTYDDSVAPSTYSTGTLAPVAGTNTAPWSAKYVLADENRILFAGSFETASYASRVGFSAVIGSTDVGDDERYPSTTTQKNYLNLDQGDGGGITGLGGPLNGSPYAFKLGQIYKLVRTGVSVAPYVPVTVSKSVGCLRHQTIANGEDEDGNPALYFLSREGPYRISPRGLQYLGNDIRDVWATVNLAATTAIAHGVYYPEKHQYWAWVATGSSNEPDTRIIFDVRRGVATVGGVRFGWAKHTGESCKARCSAMLPLTFAATQTIATRPHIGYSQTNAKLWRCDTTDLDDGGTTFQAYVKTKPYALAKLGRNYGLTEIHLLAKALAATSVYCTVIRDFGLESRTFNVSIAPTVAAEERVIRQFEDCAMAQAGTIQFQIGDNAAGSIPQWTLESMAVRFSLEEADR